MSVRSPLQQALESCAGRSYPLHMPGHKRRMPPAPGLGCYAWDTTEVPGTDDLHDAGGILAAAMARTGDGEGRGGASPAGGTRIRPEASDLARAGE